MACPHLGETPPKKKKRRTVQASWKQRCAQEESRTPGGGPVQDLHGHEFESLACQARGMQEGQGVQLEGGRKAVLGELVQTCCKAPEGLMGRCISLHASEHVRVGCHLVHQTWCARCQLTLACSEFQLVQFFVNRPLAGISGRGRERLQFGGKFPNQSDLSCWRTGLSGSAGEKGKSSVFNFIFVFNFIVLYVFSSLSLFSFAFSFHFWLFRIVSFTFP